MKEKHFRHENAGEAVYDADKHKSTDDGIESLIIMVVCLCEFSFGYLSVRFVICVVSGW